MISILSLRRSYLIVSPIKLQPLLSLSLPLPLTNQLALTLPLTPRQPVLLPLQLVLPPRQLVLPLRQMALTLPMAVPLQMLLQRPPQPLLRQSY